MRHIHFCLFLLILPGLIASKPRTAAGAPPSASLATPPLTGPDLVGLWSGNVRVPGHTEMWQFMPKIIVYQKSGTSVTVFLRNTVLFEKSGKFVVTTEGDNSTSTPRQYQGHYSVSKAVLTMAFEKVVWGAAPYLPEPLNTSFQYTLSRWNDELQLGDATQPGFGTLLGPMTQEWQPRKGSPFYQGRSGLMQLEMDGGLNQSYHYRENGITHYADVHGRWRLARPIKPHETPLIRLEGVRDGRDFYTVTVSAESIPGLNAEIKQLQDSPTVILYSYSLELVQVADTKPTQYVWAVHLDSSLGWQPEPAPVPPPTLYPSLVSPDLQQLISRMPLKTRLVYTPRWHGISPTNTAVAPDDPEYGLKDFGEFCKSKGVRFDLNYNRF